MAVHAVFINNVGGLGLLDYPELEVNKQGCAVS
jgi:hypothetical protein